jgi:site-specific recombinase XerD
VKEDGTPYQSVGSAFQRACQRAKLSGISPHTLRHTFASRLVMEGVNLRAVQVLGGWRTIAMVERYSHLTEQHLADAVERLAHFTSTTVSDSDANSLTGLRGVEIITAS